MDDKVNRRIKAEIAWWMIGFVLALYTRCAVL